MKFWKNLSVLIEDTLPEWRDKFLSYKDLKKQLKLIYPKDGCEDHPPPKKRLRSDGRGDEVAKEVNDFVRLLEDEMEKFNSFIVEKEEDSVIKWKELQERVETAKSSHEELMRVGREIVDFHGEMVLLENYSALNYTGLVKILKKYDKRTGDVLRLPFIQKVMQQPFFTTHVLNQLVKECEMMLESLFPKDTPTGSSETKTDDNNEDNESKVDENNETKRDYNNKGNESKTSTESKEKVLKVPAELPEIESMEGMYMKRALSALNVLKEIRSGSSTVNMFSLPPLQNNSLEEQWKEAPSREQEAK